MFKNENVFWDLQNDFAQVLIIQFFRNEGGIWRFQFVTFRLIVMV